MRQFINIVEIVHMSVNEGTERWNDKNVASTVGDYRIVVDEPNDTTYVTVWTSDNKRVGELATRRTPDEIGRNYLGISHVEVLPAHRGYGLGLAMYNALLDNLPPKWKGIASYLPDQANQKQIPQIWKRLGGEIIDDHTVVDRK